VGAQGIWGIVVFLLVFAFLINVRRRRRGVRTFDIGPGAYGSVYDLLNQDRRNAIELIVEEKAEARDPEDADGNLPELERPGRSTSSLMPNDERRMPNAEHRTPNPTPNPDPRTPNHNRFPAND
jgi:hypothetical protein